MTTVAYRDGVLAADTLMTADGKRAGYMTKIHRVGRLLIGFCGRSANYEAFRNWVSAGMPDQFKSADGNVFIIPPDGPPVVWGDGDTPWRETSPAWALGSGQEIAMGAMAAGASADAAVRIASEIDTGTGGEVTVLRLGDLPREGEALIEIRSAA